MNQSGKPAVGHSPFAFLTGGGEMGERIRAFDWSKTPLGPDESWSPALRTVVRLMLANCLPMMLWWGPPYMFRSSSELSQVDASACASAMSLSNGEGWKLPGVYDNR
jgi:hypothetical protein